MSAGQRLFGLLVIRYRMANRRGKALVSFVVFIAVVQIAVEDVVVFLDATGAVGSVVPDSMYVYVGVPFISFLLLAAALFAWAFTGQVPRQ